MKKFIFPNLILCAAVSLFSSCTKDRVPNPTTLNVAQTTIYNENFDETSIVSPNFPNGWHASNGWKNDSSNFSTTYTGASGMRNLDVSNDAVNSFSDTLYSKVFTTTNFNSITVIYGARRSSHFSDNGSSISNFAYSVNG